LKNFFTQNGRGRGGRVLLFFYALKYARKKIPHYTKKDLHWLETFNSQH
jgi:hypothetical protein